MTHSTLSRMAFAAALLLLASGATASATPAGGPNVEIEYLGSTAEPQRGDYVFVRALATNNEAYAVPTRFYMRVDYPNGVNRTYSVLSSTFPANSSFQVQKVKRIKFPVPLDAPDGTYDVTLYAANDLSNGGAIYDTDSFQFTIGAPISCVGTDCSNGGVTPANVEVDVVSWTSNPQRGDYLFIRATATNYGLTEGSTAGYTGRVYFTVDYPDATSEQRNVLSGTLNEGQTVKLHLLKGRRMRYFIPGEAPEGWYNVTLYIADDIAEGGTIRSSDSFSFYLGCEIFAATGGLGGCDTVAEPVVTAAALIASPEAGPNPFRTETTIRYELAEDADVDLRVYDVRGREVAQLATGTQSAGTHSAVFAAEDLPGGVYVWRLSTDGEVQTGRVTLAR